MTDEELRVEWTTLCAEGERLRAEHQALRDRPHDVDGRRAHVAHLRAYRQRLREYADTRDVTLLERWLTL